MSANEGDNAEHIMYQQYECMISIRISDDPMTFIGLTPCRLD